MTIGSSEQPSAEHYSATLIDHFERPRNAGALEDADVDTYVTNPVCGDSVRLFLRFDEAGERIEAASFLSSGCPASIATSSVATELIAGLTLDEAVALTRDDYTEAVGGLPRSKVHCSVLAAAAVRNAVDAYRRGETSAEATA